MPPSGPSHIPAAPSTATSGARELVWTRLTVLAGIVFAGWALATAFHYYHETVLGHGYPYSTFVFTPVHRFGDLIEAWTVAARANPYWTGDTPSGANYFPLAYALLGLLRSVSQHTLLGGYLLVTFAAMGLILAGWLRSERERFRGDNRWPAVVMLAAALTFLSYPLLLAVDRGNVEPLIAVLVVAAIALLERERPGAGALVLAVAAALKGYPLAFFGLWVRRRQFVAAAAGVGATALLVVAPGLWLEGGVAHTLAGLRHGLDAFHELYVVGGRAGRFSSDWINAVRLLGRATQLELPMAQVVTAYERLVLPVAALLGLHAMFLAQTRSRALLALVSLVLVFPNITNDYKLVLLLPVALTWITDPPAGRWRDRAFVIAMGLLLVPKQYAFFHGSDASISCLLNPLLVTTLVATLWPTSDERAGAAALMASARARASALATRSR